MTTTHKVQTIIAGAALVVLVVVGVAIGVSQSKPEKEDAATIVVSSETETEIVKEEISTEAETEVATETTEEATEKNSSEMVDATNDTSKNTQTTQNTNNNASNTKTQQPETPQQAPAQETPVPQTPAPEAPAPAPEEEYDPAAKGMVQDAYGNWVPPTSDYVVKEGLCGTVLMSDGRKILGEGAMSHFSDEINAWTMEVYKNIGVVPNDEETREFVYIMVCKKKEKVFGFSHFYPYY